MKPSVPTVYLQWEQCVGTLLDRTRGFPKAIRHTFTQRIENRALDVLEALVEARYARRGQKTEALHRANVNLARLRALLRLAHARAHLDHRSFEHLSRELDQTGRMIGGWQRQQAS